MARKRVKVSENQIGFDQIAVEFDVPKAAVPRRGRPTPTAELDLSARPQTRLKLLSLGEYLPVWFAKISHRAPDAYYIDFFAGPGVYVNGITTIKGSPILACDAAAAMVEWHSDRGRNWTPHLRFVEPDEATRSSLVKALAPFDGVVDYRIVALTADAALPGLLAESAGSPTLAFFDPWGYGIGFDMIAAFARPGLNEVLVSFDAQAIKRNVAADQLTGITAFSGGDWWTALVDDTDLDLDAYLRGLCGQFRIHFPYAGVQQFEFLGRHALRAVAQCCGSLVGRTEWMKATKKSRREMTVVNDIFPELDRQTLANQIIERWSTCAGNSMTFKQAETRLADIVWDQPTMDQVLAFLRERALVSWEDKVAREGYGYRWMTFNRPWPETLAWDGVTREAPARRARSPVPIGR